MGLRARWWLWTLTCSPGFWCCTVLDTRWERIRAYIPEALRPLLRGTDAPTLPLSTVYRECILRLLDVRYLPYFDTIMAALKSWLLLRLTVQLDNPATAILRLFRNEHCT